MGKSLREVISENTDIYFVKITKPDKHNRSTWIIDFIDNKCELCGTRCRLEEFEYSVVTLRRGNHFFLAYKIRVGVEKYEYFVDTRKANHRTSIQKFVENLKMYQTKSNDISTIKNATSFRLTDKEMNSRGINNFVEMCYEYRDFSAIGIGLTRDVRNLIVLDIDVDCKEPENNEELNRILLLFAQNNILPDFEIHNLENGHIQLQWLIQSLQYKKVSDKLVGELIYTLETDKEWNRELSLLTYSFLDDTNDGDEYKLFTRALTDLSTKHKFGDKNFTFWKAKNFCTALFGMYDLELKMPQYYNGRIIYLQHDEMFDLFSTKDARTIYYDEAPTFQTIVNNSKSIMYENIEKEKPQLLEIKEKSEDFFVDVNTRKDCDVPSDGESRNSFVLSFTRTTTWDVCRSMGLKGFDDINKLPQSEQKKIESKVKKIVKSEFVKRDEEYSHIWPGTSNPTIYTSKEFNSTFKNAFDYAKCKFKNTSKYSDEQRRFSCLERGLKKYMKLVVVDYYRNTNKDIKREELLRLVNKTLKNSNQKEMSLSTLKRCIDISKSLTEEDRTDLYVAYYDTILQRKDLLVNTDDNDEKMKKTNKRRLDYISINIVDDIMKSIEY